MGRAPCCEKVGLNRGRWTEEEDEKLTNYILQHGEGSWRSLPKNAGLLRCGKSCRLRWINYLRSGLKRGNITSQEEDTIIKLHAILGNRWSAIAGQLPGRTDNEIKNYWNSHLSRRIHTIKSPNGEENVINLTNASAPPKHRRGRASRATMQRNKANANININQCNGIDVSLAPQLVPRFEGNIVEGNNKTIISEQESELLGIEDIMSLDGPSEINGLMNVGLIKQNQDHRSPTTSNVGGSTTTTTTTTTTSSSSLSCFDQLNLDIELGLNFETHQIMSWLLENDDNYLEQSLSDVAVEKEQAMLAWLMS
ncbi:hypothetical protein vseg_016925 [Gypsophila vaccaria]